MNKKFFGILILIIIVVFVGLYFSSRPLGEEKEDTFASSYKDAEYVIEGQRIKLTNGVAETESAPGSASKIVTRYFGNEVFLDLNDDNREDIVFLVSQETGGSGTFYYVVAALNTLENGYIGSEGLLLGDRIAPQTTERGNGKVVVVNYVVRAPGESFAIRPSIGKSIWLLLDTKTMQFGEVAQNFEGETDPSRMSLGMNTWNWVNTTYSDGKIVSPKSPNKFTITFKAPNTFSATTDCNSVSGSYKTDKNKIFFGEMRTTLMFCEGSQESEFNKSLGEVQDFKFTSRGELIFNLKSGGTMTFR